MPHFELSEKDKNSLIEQLAENVPEDIKAAKSLHDAVKGAKSRPLPFIASVCSTFDARPINAKDFYITSPVPGSDVTNDITNTLQVGSLSWRVPAGHIAILRNIQYQFSTLYFPYPLITVNMTVDIDGEFSPGILGNGFPQETNGNPIPVYIIADQNKTITVTVNRERTDGGIFPIPEYLNIIMYGNLLMRRGLPAQFEPGNIRPKTRDELRGLNAIGTRK